MSLEGLRVELVLERLQKLDQALRRLERFRGWDLARYMDDEDAQWIVERGLHLALEAVFDIGNHLLSALGAPPPQDYRSILTGLEKAGILPPDFAKRIEGMAGFRNILVHEYATLDVKEVHRILQEHAGDLADFARLVVAFTKLDEQH